jgi:U3 small nucleolar RNA-associated protein 10
MSEYVKTLGMAIDKHSKSAITKNVGVLSSILLKVFDLRRLIVADGETGDAVLARLTQLENSVNDKVLKMIYKLNDATFRPVFVQLIEWSSTGLKGDSVGLSSRRYSVYGFLQSFFDNLKSIVTNYATYVLEDAVTILSAIDPKASSERQLWNRVLNTLAKCFEHDQDDFWQAPAHFGAIAPVLMEQYTHATIVDVNEALIPTTVELAAAADSQAHQKELNSALLKHLRSEKAAVRLAAVKCEQALTDRLGEEWLAMLHEMLPRISELQEDDDEVVERETHRWIVKIEGVLGESLDSMLQ